MNEFDKKCMLEAVAVARKGNTLPNPFVGCVIAKGRKVIARGYHRKHGEAHAEIDALSKISQKQARGATIYLTLEPCATHGNTPPCVDTLLKIKPKRIVIGMRDPNPETEGKSIRMLRKAGISVELLRKGRIRNEIEEMNREYVKFITEKTPFVILKSAVTQDGKITWADGKNKQISGKESRVFVHHIRNRVNAIVVGINTVLKDNPSLTTRLPDREKKHGRKNKGKDPLRIILDSSLKIPLNATVLKSKNVIVVTTKRGMHRQKAEQVAKKVKRMIVFDERINLKRLMKVLAREENVASVLLEGGTILNSAAMQAKIVDEMVLLISNFSVRAKGKELFDRKVKRFRIEKPRANICGQDLIIDGRVKYK